MLVSRHNGAMIRTTGTRFLSVDQVGLATGFTGKTVRRWIRPRRSPRRQAGRVSAGAAQSRRGRARGLARGPSPERTEPMTPRFEDNPPVYLAYQRARMKAIQAQAEKKLGRSGGETATRRPAGRSASAPSSGLPPSRPRAGRWGGSSPARARRTLSATRARSRSIMGSTGRARGCATSRPAPPIQLSNGRSVRFHPQTGKVTPR